MSDTILVSRPLPKKKRRRIQTTRSVQVGINHRPSISVTKRSDSIKKMVEEQMKVTGYKRNEDPLLNEIKKIANKYQARM